MAFPGGAGVSSSQLASAVLVETNRALGAEGALCALADSKIAATEKAAANGVATLDATKLVPVVQLPPDNILVTDSDNHKYIGSSPNQTGLAVQTNTNQEAGAWATVAYSGAFTMFPGVAAGNTCYIGVTNKADMAGIIANVTTAQVLGAGSVVPEFWYGGGWATWDISTVRHTTPYTYYADAPFGAVEKQDIRPNDGFQGMQSSVAKTLNGVLKHWIRFRIAVGITTAPVINGLWVIGSATMFSPTGEQFFFGAARPYNRLVLAAMYEPLRRVTGSTPGNTGIPYATGTTANIDLQQQYNSLANGALDALGCAFACGYDYDGGSGVTLVVRLYPSTTNTGNIELEANIVKVSDGDVLTTASRSAFHYTSTYDSTRRKFLFLPPR